jgi:GNAT superfamily N-acetyltransferase
MNIALQHRTTSTSSIEIVLATVADVPDVARLFSMFFHESIWHRHLTYNEEKARKRLEYMIGNGFAPHLIARHLGEPIGVISYHIDKNYTDEGIGVMNETYVVPAFRKTNLGRKLVALAIHLARGDGCTIFNFPLASGLIETRTYANMLKKFGAQQCGMIFCKVL